MGIHTDKFSRTTFLFASMVVMLVGLFVSRAMLSIGMMAFAGLGCLHRRFYLQIKTFRQHPILPGISLLFFIPFVSGLWSENGAEWSKVTGIKLPLLLMPLALAGPWQLSLQQWNRLTQVFLLLLFIGCCWSIGMYIRNADVLSEAYLRAKVIPTPLEDDHVRYSWLVCAGVLFSLRLYTLQKEKRVRLPLAALMVFFVIYLHLLSARTGLISLYIFFFLLVLRLASTVRVRGAVLLALAAIALPVAAWFLFPTFQNRIRYNLYDLSYVKKQTYLPGSNDGNRVMSLKAGWDVLKANPLGVGAGDLSTESRNWYAANVPGMLQSDQFYPSSEWLVYGGFAGWAGVLLFTTVMLLPFFEKNRSGWFNWISLNIIAAFSFLFDIGLEVQFGVFIYSFLVLWLWKWRTEEARCSNTL